MMPPVAGGKVDTTPAHRPELTPLTGESVVLVPLDPSAHAHALWAGLQGHDEVWAYLPDGPYASEAALAAAMTAKARSRDPVFYAILDRKSGAAAGYASYLRIEPAHRVIEVGHITYTPALQRTRGGTEAMYLMARHVFEDLGYRRYEWKCNALNEKSRRAALRFGFTFEGVFRQHMIVKGENRDTAWFSMIDAEWPARKARFERWLDPSNFDASGRQRQALSAITA